MNFTREPLVETVITPKEGHKLVIRNSKGGGQEEFFVDAVEVITFGKASFFRSLEKPKSFLVPVADYEIIEVRESRMVLKTTGTEKGIKIGGGRDSSLKAAKEEVSIPESEAEALIEQRSDKRRERRRSRKRRGKSESEEHLEAELEEPEIAQPEKKGEKPSLIPPPSTLISETIGRYKLPPAPEAPSVEPEKPSEKEDEEVPF